jgi:hypothetical protein
MARSATAHRPRSSAACASWPGWPKAWAAVRRLGGVRWPPTPSCQGWGKPPRNARPFPPTCSGIGPSTSGTSPHCTPCGAASKRARAAQRKPANALRVPAPGCGQPAILRARGWWPSRAARGPTRGGPGPRGVAPTGGAAGARGGGARLCTAVSARWPQGLRHGPSDPFWSVDAARTAPGERPKTSAAVDSAAGAALRARGDGVPAPPPRGGHAPRGVRHPPGPRAGLSGLGVDAQHGVCGAAQPRHPPARRGPRAPGQPPLPGASGLARSGGLVPGVSPCRVPPGQFTPGTRRTAGHERQGLRQGVAAVDPGDGGGLDRARMVSQRGVTLSGATVAPAADG